MTNSQFQVLVEMFHSLSQRIDDVRIELKTEMAQGFAKAEENLRVGLLQADKNLQKGLLEADRKLQKGLLQADRNLQKGLLRADRNLQEGLARYDKKLQDGLSLAEENLKKGPAQQQEISQEILRITGETHAKLEFEFIATKDRNDKRLLRLEKRSS